ncbi:MAG: hypothetical protein JKX97_02220 [Candidatus Lindowbacteria bacterium]|nr:hypothetical protein [Candidatus Lindowbacteria bacterium]
MKTDDNMTIPCYLCSSQERELVEEIKEKPDGETNFDIPKGEYLRKVYRCKNCDVYLNLHELLSEDFYKSDYSDATYSGKILEKYNKIRALPEGSSDNKPRVERVHKFCSSFGRPTREIRILDVGSGLAVFPGELVDLGYQSHCIELDQRAIDHALESVGESSGRFSFRCEISSHFVQ